MTTRWIDTMQDMWASIQGEGFKTIRAPYYSKRAEFPSSIDAKDLLVNPIAISVVAQRKYKYASGGPNECFYQGVTEFHVAPSLDMGLLPRLEQYPELIAAKAAANMLLGGLVSNFVLQAREDQITGPVELQYGNESAHWGFIVYWEVKENVNSAITVATGA